MDLSKVVVQLERNGYNVSSFENTEDASIYLQQHIQDKIVGFGDSATLASLDLYEKLRVHNTVYSPQDCTIDDDFIHCAKKCLTAEIFLTSVNAMSKTGCLVNIDGTGNRIAGSLFGHEKVYFVVGTNKIVDTVEDAMWRARNIAAPQNAKRLKLKTPCAKEGKRCYDCASPERICNGLIIHYKKMNDIEMEIVLIDQPLGF